MPSITQRKIRMVNPGSRRKRKRNLSLKQMLHFGSKRQRNYAKTKLHRSRTKSNPKRRKRNVVYQGKDTRYKSGHYKYSSNPKSRKRSRNVGSIITVLPASLTGNPGRRKHHKKRSNSGKTMARATRKQLRALAKARAARKRYAHGNKGHRRRSSNPGIKRHRRRSYPVARRRRRSYSSNPSRRRRNYSSHRRYRHSRNPGILSGTTGRVLGVIGGATLTKLLVGFVPSSFTTGFLGYIAIGAVAYLQGIAIGKVMKNPSVGQDFLTGGLVYLAIKMLNDFVPSLGGNLGLSGGRGMGLIAPSSFYLPQVNQMNSMGQFVRPSMVPAPYVPAATSPGGMGNVRRMGRVR